MYQQIISRNNLLTGKRNPTKQEKIFINHTSDKRSILVYKETLKFNNKIQYNQILKQAKNLSKHFPRKGIQMANKYIISHRKMQIKTTMKYHSTPTRKAIIFLKWKTTVLARIWRNWNTRALLVGTQNRTAATEAVCQFLKGSNIEFPHDVSTSTNNYILKKRKTLYTNAHSNNTQKERKQRPDMPINRCVNKMW